MLLERNKTLSEMYPRFSHRGGTNSNYAAVPPPVRQHGLSDLHHTVQRRTSQKNQPKSNFPIQLRRAFYDLGSGL